MITKVEKKHFLRKNCVKLTLLSALIIMLTAACGLPAPQSAKPPQRGKAQGQQPAVNTDQKTWGTVSAQTFIDPLQGWIGNGREILATTDGGKTWSKLSTVSNTVYDIGFVSPERGWLFTGDAFDITQDGGRTWRKRSIPHTAGISLEQLQFVDEKHGWILGTGQGPMTPVPNSPGEYEINPIMIFWHTTDGGRTWTRIDVPSSMAKDEFFGYCRFSFILPDRGWLLLGTQPAARIQGKTLFRTTDGGLHWTEISSIGFDSPGTTNSLPGGGYISGLYFLNDREGWLAEARGFICVTTDGGRTWRPLGKEMESSMFDTQFFNLKDGYAVYRDNLMTTRDGGITWKQIYK